MMRTGLKWPEARPFVPNSVCSTPTTPTELGPHEVLKGGPMSSGSSPPLTPDKVTLVWTDDSVSAYVKRLAASVR